MLELVGPIPDDDDAPLLPKENKGMSPGLAAWTNANGMGVEDAEEVNVSPAVGDDDKADDDDDDNPKG